MLIYIATIFILFAFSILESKGLHPIARKCLYYISFFIVLLQVGLRWETGTDWSSYYDIFRMIQNSSDISPFSSGVEIGYGLFIFLTKLISDNYSIFLTIHAFVYLSLMFININDYVPENTFLAILLYYTTTMGVLGSNRQLIAIGICFGALRFVKEKGYIIFSTLILIATYFHSTAILFALYYFIDKRFKSQYLLPIIIFCFFLGKTDFPFLVFSVIGEKAGFDTSKVIFYLNSANDALLEYRLSLLGLLKRIIFISIFLYNRDKLIKIFPYYNLMLNGYIISLMIYFLFMNSLLIIVSRGGLYFTIMEPLLLATQLSLIKRQGARLCALVLMLIYSIFIFIKSIEAYPALFLPYKGLFINMDHNTDYRRYIHWNNIL